MIYPESGLFKQDEMDDKPTQPLDIIGFRGFSPPVFPAFWKTCHGGDGPNLFVPVSQQR